MSAQSSIRNTLLVDAHIGTQAADVTLPVAHLPRKSVIKSVKLLDGVGVAADNSNYLLLSLQKGSTVIATLDTRAAGQGAITAHTAKSFVIVAGQEEQLKLSDLKLVIDANGTVTLTNAKLVLQIDQKGSAD